MPREHNFQACLPVVRRVRIVPQTARHDSYFAVEDRVGNRIEAPEGLHNVGSAIIKRRVPQFRVVAEDEFVILSVCGKGIEEKLVFRRFPSSCKRQNLRRFYSRDSDWLMQVLFLL